MSRIKVGVIGLGDVAQIIHLPVLETLADRYEITALCDLSHQLLQRLGDRYQVERRYTDAGELARQPDLDAVLVLNSNEYHTEAVVAAARNGKHVLVEKPMCLTLAETKAIIRARDDAGVQVMVAYMRRYAPAFEQAVEEVRKLDRITYARIRDIIGPNRFYIDQSSDVHRPTDIPEAAVRERRQRTQRLVCEAIGDDAEELSGAYLLLCGLSSHDISAMRELIGVPNRVVGAAQWNGGWFFTAIFEYDGFCATFETGIDGQGRFDAHIEVYGQTRSVRVEYDQGFIRHLPTTLHLSETVGESYREQVVRPTYRDPYTYELEHFHEVVTHNRAPKTTPEDFAEDLKIFRMIVDAFRRR